MSLSDILLPAEKDVYSVILSRFVVHSERHVVSTATSISRALFDRCTHTSVYSLDVRIAPVLDFELLKCALDLIVGNQIPLQHRSARAHKQFERAAVDSRSENRPSICSPYPSSSHGRYERLATVWRALCRVPGSSWCNAHSARQLRPNQNVTSYQADQAFVASSKRERGLQSTMTIFIMDSRSGFLGIRKCEAENKACTVRQLDF